MRRELTQPLLARATALARYERLVSSTRSGAVEPRRKGHQSRREVEHGNRHSQHCINTLPSREAYCVLSRKVAQDLMPIADEVARAHDRAMRRVVAREAPAFGARSGGVHGRPVRSSM